MEEIVVILISCLMLLLQMHAEFNVALRNTGFDQCRIYRRPNAVDNQYVK